MLEIEINILEHIVKAIPKNLQHNSIKALFSDIESDISFDIKNEDLMDDLQKIADYNECTLYGDTVFAEMNWNGLFDGYTLLGFYLDDNNDEEDDEKRNVFFSVNEYGVVFDVDYN